MSRYVGQVYIANFLPLALFPFCETVVFNLFAALLVYNRCLGSEIGLHDISVFPRENYHKFYADDSFHIKGLLKFTCFLK